MCMFRPMMRVLLAAALVCLAGATGCNSGSSNPPVDGGQDGWVDGDDGGADAADGGDLLDGADGADGTDGSDGGPTAAGPTRLAPTSGSGTAESVGHKVRLHVGAPQPFGAAGGPGGAVKVGPEAGP